MSEQLREKIAIKGATAYFEVWEKLFEEQKDNWRQWARESILPLIKEALPELAKEAGYVKLAKDQSLPEDVGCCMDCNDSNKMLKAGWRKVEVKDEKYL